MYGVRRFGKDSPSWKGGKITKGGYIYIYKPEHPFCDGENYVAEHRFVIEQQIGRYLLSKEDCHHRNNIKDDNRPQNLMAFISKSAHMRFEKKGLVKPEEIIFNGERYANNN